jgi:hypothetical protein
MLEDFLRRVARHPILSGEHVFHRFLDNEVSWVSRREDSSEARRVVGREITREEGALTARRSRPMDQGPAERERLRDERAGELRQS